MTLEDQDRIEELNNRTREDGSDGGHEFQGFSEKEGDNLNKHFFIIWLILLANLNHISK